MLVVYEKSLNSMIFFQTSIELWHRNQCGGTTTSHGGPDFTENSSAGTKGQVLEIVLPRLRLLTGYSKNRQLVIAVTIDGSADN